MARANSIRSNAGIPDIELDSLAQVRNQSVFRTGSTIQKDVSWFYRTAKRKGPSVRVHTALAELRNEREGYYRRSIYCAEEVVIDERGHIRTQYCNGRLCAVCQAIRTGKAINKYLPGIEAFNDPFHVVLTTQSVRSTALASTVRRMRREFTGLKEVLRKCGSPVHGLLKLEISCTDPRGEFHPHLHLIVDSELTSCAVVDQWLRRNRSVARPEAQDIRRVDKDESLRRVFGYVTKLITPYEQGGHAVPPECLDVIVASVFGIPTLQAYGALYGRKQSNVEVADCRPVVFVTDEARVLGERIFCGWNNDMRTWLERDTGKDVMRVHP